MKISCVRCSRVFPSRGIHISGNAVNMSLKDVQIDEQCPYCGFIFNPYKDGVYDVEDGVPTLVKTLEGLVIPRKSVNRLASTDFSIYSSDDALLNRVRTIDLGLFDLIKKWITDGITLLAIISALTFYANSLNDKKQVEFKIPRLDISLPNSFIKSHEESLKKDRPLDSLNFKKIREKNR